MELTPLAPRAVMNVAVGFLALNAPLLLSFLTFAPIAHTHMAEAVVRDRTETSGSLMDTKTGCQTPSSGRVYVCESSLSR